MINKKDKNQARLIRHKRVRTKVSGTTVRPRLNVYRSLNEIYAQIIDDTKGATIVSASTRDKDLLKKVKELSKSEAAALVGKTIAEKQSKQAYKKLFLIAVVMSIQVVLKPLQMAQEKQD